MDVWLFSVIFLIIAVILYYILQAKVLRGFLNKNTIFILGILLCVILFFTPYYLFEKNSREVRLLQTYSLVDDSDRNVVIASGFYKNQSVLYIDELGQKQACMINRKIVYKDLGNSRLEIWKTKWGFLEYKKKKVFINH